jgi:hypothetical protein
MKVDPLLWARMQLQGKYLDPVDGGNRILDNQELQSLCCPTNIARK